MTETGLADLRLRFASQVLPEDTFVVVSFTAKEGLSQLYAVRLSLASSRRDLDLDAVMAAAASFSIARPQGDVFFHGILESFTEAHEANGLYFYEALLRPRLWSLTQQARNQVFVGKTLPEVLTQVLTEGGLPGSSFAFRLQGSYPAREFICQYRETLYDFLLRWMARYGLYYSFEQGAAGEVLVITDTRIAQTPAPGAERLVYARTSGLEAATAQETVHDFGSRRTLGPASVTLKDYNYRKPALDLSATRQVPLQGAGETYRFGDHHRTPGEGENLAKLRTESLAAEARQVYGTSFAPGLRPGYTFELVEHYDQSQNGTYLAVTVNHQGQAALAGTAGLGQDGGEEARLHYQNTFTAIAAADQYRPSQPPRSTLAGLMTAHVDAAGSGTYAELDEDGRYKIRLPFDQSGLPDGKASAPVRLLQPFVGAGFGLHCPLHKGTEVALGYVDGNPDRPVILGAAPNPDNKSQVTSANQTKCCLTTGSGHQLHLEDQEGSQRVMLYSSTGDFMRIGAHNDPDGDEDQGWGPFSEEGIRLYAPGSHWLNISFKNEFLLVLGEYMLNILGWDNEMRVMGLEFNIALKVSFYLAYKMEFESFHEALEAYSMRTHPAHNTLHGTNQTMTMADVRTSATTTATALSDSHTSLDSLHVAQEATKTAGDETSATAVELSTTQMEQQLAADETQAYQDALHLSQTKQDLAAQKTLIAEDVMASHAEKSVTFATKNETSLDRIGTAGNKISTVADELISFGIMSKN
jgi:type VI secretion system secreted protein VgrG